jgi:hypothetical protein
MEFVRIVLGCIVGGYLAGILIDRFVCETIERRNGSGRYVFVSVDHSKYTNDRNDSTEEKGKREQ